MTPERALTAGVALEARQLAKRFSTPGHGDVRVFEQLSLVVREGEVLAIVGPNGAGKTTLLQVLAGLQTADAGEVGFATKARSISMVFQDVAGSLLPWRTNLDNIALPLEVAGVPRAERLTRVRQHLEAWGKSGDLLTELGISPNSFPYMLSGGQRQWLAILRAYVANPAVVLLDEPFSALDVHGRLLAQACLAELHHREPRATIVVSHELDEAVFLADRVVVLSRRPARVLADIKVELPRPRPPLHDVLEDSRYLALCRAVQQAFLGALA